MKMDTIQQVLALVRNIGQSYAEAKPTLKQLFLGLFWHHFEVEDRKIIQAVKSPIVLALEAAGKLTMNELKKPIPNEYSEAGEPVRLSNVRGRTVEDVRKIFERIDDATIYIPSFENCYPTPQLTVLNK